MFVAVALVLTGAAVRWSRVELVAQAEVEQAVTETYPSRQPAFPLPRASTNGPQASVVPASCGELLIRPWLVDAWPAGTVGGSQTGAADADSYPSFEVVSFTTAKVNGASNWVVDLDDNLASPACRTVTVETPVPGNAPFSVDITSLPADPVPMDGCVTLRYRATASVVQPGVVRAVQVEVLQYANTISLLIMEDGPLDPTAYVGVERPTLATSASASMKPADDEDELSQIGHDLFSPTQSDTVVPMGNRGTGWVPSSRSVVGSL